MQACTSLQTDNHTSTPPLSFLQAGCPSCHPTNSVKALKAKELKAKALKAKYNGRKMVVIQLVLVVVVDDAQEHWSVALRQVAKSCFIWHHRSRRTVLLPVCRLWQIDLLELELITWLKHKSQKHCWGTSSQKIERWGVGVVICLEQGADRLHVVQLMSLLPKTPSSLASFKSRLVYLSGTSLPSYPENEAVKRV